MTYIRETVDFAYIEPQHGDIHARLLNWGRWAEVRPSYTVCPMFRMARSNSRQWHQPEVRDTIDVLDAAKLERAVAGLPVPHRDAIRWFYVIKHPAERAYRRKHGLRPEGLLRALRDARQMLESRL